MEKGVPYCQGIGVGLQRFVFLVVVASAGHMRNVVEPLKKEFRQPPIGDLNWFRALNPWFL